jgi:hypothetical protein
MVFNIAGLPSTECAEKLCPFLHGAVDTPVLKELARTFPGHVRAATVETIDEAI